VDEGNNKTELIGKFDLEFKSMRMKENIIRSLALTVRMPFQLLMIRDRASVVNLVAAPFPERKQLKKREESRHK
jgi:hypothetical protein